MIVGVSGLINWVIGLVKWLVRWKSPDLMALEAGWPALRDYFLNLNPYFNYAFRVDKNYFLILDTGFDSYPDATLLGRRPQETGPHWHQDWHPGRFSRLHGLFRRQ